MAVRPIISMELVAGGTLQDAIRKDGPMPIRMAVDAILQVIDGLEAAEKVGVHTSRHQAHRIALWTTNGVIKVGDFGLSVSTAGSEDSMVSRDQYGARHTSICIARTVTRR